MKYKKAKIIFAAWTLLAGLACLFGCFRTVPPSPPPDNSESSITEAVDNTIDLSAYTVIYSDDATSAEKMLATTLQNRLRAVTGRDIKLENDLISGADGGSPDTYEILIGRTNRSATAAALAAVDYADYTIKADGRKIVVAGWLDAGTEEAIRSFTKMVNNAVGGKLNAAVLHGGTVDDMPRGVPAFEGGKKPRVTDTGADSYVFTASSVSTGEYASYLSELLQLGWETLYTNDIAGSLYACLRDANSSTLLFVSRTAKRSKLRIAAEPYRSYSLDHGSRGTLPLQVVAGNCCDRIYYVRLPDGSIIVIDGDCSGSAGEKRAQTDAFVSELTEITGAASIGEVNIAAWIFTHVHTDHILMFTEMTSRFGDELNIGCILRSFPSSHQMQLADDDATSWVIYFDQAVERLSKKPEMITVHAGQKFTFSGVEFEYIYTHEEIYPSVMKILNQTSTVFRMKYNGQTVLWTGDMTDEESNRLLSELGADAVSCDAVQIGHHGWNNGGTPNFYRACGASVMLWTNKYETWRQALDAGKLVYTDEIYNTAGVKRHIWCLSGKPEILEFPFK